MKVKISHITAINVTLVLKYHTEFQFVLNRTNLYHTEYQFVLNQPVPAFKQRLSPLFKHVYINKSVILKLNHSIFCETFLSSMLNISQKLHSKTIIKTGDMKRFSNF